MYVLPLGCCDVVLCVQWWMILEPILWDFLDIWMQLKVGGHKYTIKELKFRPSQIISSHHM